MYPCATESIQASDVLLDLILLKKRPLGSFSHLSISLKINKSFHLNTEVKPLIVDYFLSSSQQKNVLTVNEEVQ